MTEPTDAASTAPSTVTTQAAGGLPGESTAKAADEPPESHAHLDLVASYTRTLPWRENWRRTRSARIAGFVFCLFGLAVGAIALTTVRGLFRTGSSSILHSLLGVGFITGVTFLLLNVGLRLLLVRPKRDGTLMGARTWYWCAWLLGLMAVLGAVIDVANHQSFLISLTCAGLLCALCALIARYGYPADQDMPLIEPNKLDHAGTGRLEMLNDDKTPMEFVVTTLYDEFGIDRQAAIKLMMQVHREGSTLIPCATPEEAARIAETINARARAAGHPLTCRAHPAPPQI